MSNSLKILVVDDEPDILEFMRYNLENEGYQTETAENGNEAIKKANDFQPNIILLDIMMPGLDGIETCKELRSDHQFDNTVIAFLTARGEDYSQIAGFEAGADDYITKPIKPRVLMSRIQGLSRRFSLESDEKSLVVGDIEINRGKYLVIKSGKTLIFPRKEFELLSLLASKPGKVFTRQEILNKVWGIDVIVGDRTIDVHIRKLREKLGDDYIKTIKGIGYKFDHQ